MQAAGGLMPWLLELFFGWRIGDNHSLARMFQDQGYSYDNNNTYAFCPKTARVFSYGEQQGSGVMPASLLALVLSCIMLLSSTN